MILSAAASLVDQLDKKVLILMRDGKHIVGIMRSFDQFANLVLEDTYERRVVVPESGRASYGDVRVGLYVVRGDAIVLLGEVDPDLEETETYPEEVSATDIMDLEHASETDVQADLRVDDD
ncbi:hypothetical protein CTAYLR_007217 [Chrysophaeum taylorii]|uniref:U6 snRNA-associated Sm-like protein LSm1 n=1 Tax=Chrysophaeum taylorii TaxID=2483200 RepID=A0AAD7UBB5_9STRA|nr:hypothetical protein CTAYLR_007217 [Chrysophaeum taylorii]